MTFWEFIFKVFAGYEVVDFLYGLMLLVIIVCLYRGHRSKDVNLWDVITSTDKTGKVRTDARKLFEAGAFTVMTIAFSYQAILGKLTEWYAAIYVGAFVTAKWLRDREQRLSRQQTGEAPAP